MKEKFNEYLSMVFEGQKHFQDIPLHWYSDYNVKRGLRNADGTGVLAGLTAIGEVHGYLLDEGNRVPIEGSLRYRGISVKDMVDNCLKEDRFGFEEVAFLLTFGFLPTKDQLAEFTKFLAEHRNLPEHFAEDMILKAPSKNIMNKLERSVLALYSYDENPDDISVPNLLRQSLELISRFPTMIAYAYATKLHYFDNTSLVLHNSNPELSTAENFFYQTRANHKFKPIEAKILDMALMLHAEHGGGNNSAFAIRVLSSSNTDTYSAIAAGVGALKGPKHGGANASMMRQMEELKANIEKWDDEEEVKAYLRKILRKEAGDGTGLIYGIGHAIYSLSDPRAEILGACAKELAQETDNMKEYSLYATVAKMASEAFREEKGITAAMPVNVDFYSGFLYKMLNIPEDLYTPLFAMARVVGWCAHRIEEVMTGGKIIRPAYKSVVERSSYVPIDQR